ncbi:MULTISPECIES: glycoside hydrolase family 30 protein [Streptomyces]|uniref:Glycoside hydrolase family 30 beta sandwich domain-containing protein n=1 Tax=Streptomyces evansiae TaxID=3075535 RepID=A0ABU2R9H2_9ACTN|nr:MULTISPECIES: glycoside hydrolase family 30 beta sandwich domain-containing protein [unclassified Streptomyces]MDT0412906.1 glycoside hydrolase family 30 beta sandwich domain-containing protein [Streptomyces sp. DSM 41979]MYQ56154.1 glucosylceramidase [Streptomyces sp. SID4926]SCE54095.1 glucosylceramidase [Streptomyces sp. DfronAA-171]
MTAPTPSRRRHRALTALAAGGALLAVLTTTHGAVAEPAGPHRPSVRQWATDATTTGARLEAPVPLTTATGPADTTVRVNPGLRFQKLTGFGASLTDSSAAVLYRMKKSERSALMRQLFSPTEGIGLSTLRQPIGASDFATKGYSFDEVPAGRTDYGLRHFSLDHDTRRILPLLREAKALNPRLTVIASPWSPPSWMKTEGSMIDGKLIDKPAVYDAYARYLVKFVQGYEKAGVPVDYLTVQNEPQALLRADYPGTDLPVAQEARVIERLGAALRAAGLRTKILGFDHNWAEHPFDAKAHTDIGEDPEPDYPYDLLSTRAARWIAGTAYHCYYGDPRAQSALKASFPDKDVFETECSGGGASRTIGAMNNWARSMVFWNLALDEKHGPHTGGCTGCDGAVTIDSTTAAVTRTAHYYTLAHFSRFTRPGATRIAASVLPAEGDTSPLQATAFRNPDGSTALVVLNPDPEKPRTATLTAPGVRETTTVAPGATVTYTW